MHCGYLSLRNNWSTDCWKLSLMNTGTSTTRTRSTRKFFLPLLLPLPPPLPEASECATSVTAAFSRSDPSRVLHDLRLKPLHPRDHRLLQPLHLFLLPRLLLLRTSQQRLLEEELDGGVVMQHVRHQHHSERGSQGSHVTDVTAACGPATSGRGAGRTSGGGCFCPRGA